MPYHGEPMRIIWGTRDRLLFWGMIYSWLYGIILTWKGSISSLFYPISTSLRYCISHSLPLLLSLYIPVTKNDLTLGQFLENYCFSFKCKIEGCNLSMIEHERTFVHNTGRLNITLVKSSGNVSRCTVFNPSFFCIKHRLFRIYILSYLWTITTCRVILFLCGIFVKYAGKPLNSRLCPKVIIFVL